MLNEPVVVELKTKGTSFTTLLLTISCLLALGTNIFLNMRVIHQVQNTNSAAMPTAMLSVAQALVSNTQPNITQYNEEKANITRIINGYKKLFEYTNVMYDMLHEKKELEYLRYLVDDVTKPVFFTTEPLDVETYKNIFLMTLKKLAINKLSEDEQKLLIYAHDFVNLYLSIQF